MKIKIFGEEKEIICIFWPTCGLAPLLHCFKKHSRNHEDPARDYIGYFCGDKTRYSVCANYRSKIPAIRKEIG